jgi:pimeloyl-ACP methyl ester carboxylesterase
MTAHTFAFEERIAHYLDMLPAGAQVSPCPILMLHGWGADSSLMLPIAERMLALGHRCIVPDLPGFGMSQPPAVGWGVADYARWTLALLDHLTVDRAHLFAHSFGGRIALMLGADHADRLDKLALTAAAGIPSPVTPHVWLRLRVYKLVRAALLRAGARGHAKRLTEWYGARFGSGDYQAAQGVMRDTFLKVVNQDLRPFAGRISRPTLLLWGEQDADTPLWKGRALETLIPDAGLIVYPGGDHYAYLRHAAEVCRALHHFITH